MSCNHCCTCREDRLNVGDTLYGFCGGYFGRDSYSDKRVEAIGKDWVVARDDNGRVQFASGDPKHLVQFKTETDDY